MRFVVGLTGGIGSGKSSVAKFFANLEVDVVDTDEIAHELTCQDGSAIPPIQQLFGNDFILSDGALDRDKMRELVFSDKNARQRLEKTLHPLILAEASCRAALAHSLYVIVVVPLLFETGDYHKIIQRVLVVDCDEQMQVARTVSRSQLKAQEVRAIMAAQISRQFRLKKADDVILNNENIDSLQKQVSDLHKNYIALATKFTVQV